MAEKAADKRKESAHDINNLSDNEFHNLLEEAFTMTSVKLHDKSPMLQKLLHEVKPDDDDLKTNIKPKIGVGVRCALVKKRPERKRCKEESRSSAALRTVQGGSLQNLNKKMESGDVRVKNKLQKSGSLNCFTLMADEKLQVSKSFGDSSVSSGDESFASGLHFYSERNSYLKKSHVEAAKSGCSSQNKSDSYDDEKVYSKCNYALTELKSADSAGSSFKLACEDEMIPSEDLSTVNWDGDVYPPGTKDIEMMDLDHSDDEHSSVHSLIKLSEPVKNVSRTLVNCYSVDQDHFSNHSATSLIKDNTFLTDEVDTAIPLPLGNKFSNKDTIFLPSDFSDRPKTNLFSSRTYNGESIPDDFKRSNGRSYLDVNGNPLSDANNRKTSTGFSHYGRKDGTDVLDINARKSKRTKGTQKEMKAGDVRGNIGNLSIEELVEYITSTDKKGKSSAKNLLNDSHKKTLKNNKLNIPRIRKNEKENNKRNLPDIEFADTEIKEMVTSIQAVNNPVAGSEKPLFNSNNDCASDSTVTEANSSNVVEAIANADSEAVLSNCDTLQCEVNEVSCIGELPIAASVSEEAGFHIVTKKQRRNRFGSKFNCSTYRNKRVSDGIDRLSADCDLSQFGWHYNRKEDVMLLAGLPHGHCSQRSCIDTRRKSTSSVPPSDHSSVDNSDLDSVHSLPVKSTTVKPVLTKTSSSSSCTPQASYADITKMSMNSLQQPKLPLSSLPYKKHSTSLLNVEDLVPLLDSLHSASRDNKRDASTSTSEDGHSSIQYEGLRNSLSHAASYPSLVEASCVSSEPNLASQATSALVTTSCETFYRINSSHLSIPDESLILDNTVKDDGIPSEGLINETGLKADLFSIETEVVNLDNFKFSDATQSISDDGWGERELICPFEGTKLLKSKSLDESSLRIVASSQADNLSVSKTSDSKGGGAACLVPTENLAIFQPPSLENCNVKETKKSYRNKSLPAVIILHKQELIPQEDIEVTFGFEIDEQLLLMSEQQCEEIYKTTNASTALKPHINKAKKDMGSVVMPLTESEDDCSELKFQNGSVCAATLTKVHHASRNSQQAEDDFENFNYSHVVHYITETWDVVVREFNAGLNSAADQQHSKIQYYKGE